jgi:hypothetical protein
MERTLEKHVSPNILKKYMVGRFEKLLSFYLGYTGQESDFPKMAIQTLGEALQIIFFLPRLHRTRI